MARFLVAVVVILLAFQTQASAQPNDEYIPKTKLEAAALRQGVLLVRDYKEPKSKLATQVAIGAVSIYEHGIEQSTVKGSSIAISLGGVEGRTRTAFVDFDEIVGLSNALGTMVDTMNTWAGSVREYTEVVYQTKGEMKVGFFQKGKGMTVFITIGREFPESVYLDFNDMTLLKGAVDDAISLL